MGSGDCVYCPMRSALSRIASCVISQSGPYKPSRQFALVEEHVGRLRAHSPVWEHSPVVVYVEYNLGFEAEHHEKALGHLPGVHFRLDMRANRVGFLTTQSIKYAATEMLNVMLRDDRVAVLDTLISREPLANRTRLREQLEVFSYQYKQAENVFQKDRIALTGKVGGMCDDIAMMLIMGCYMTDHDLKAGKIPLHLSH